MAPVRTAHEPSSHRRTVAAEAPATTAAYGTSSDVAPRYSNGGWYSIARCRRIGVSPSPSMAGATSRSHGDAHTTSTIRKAAGAAASTTRSSPSARRRTTPQPARSADHNSSEPAMPPQTPAMRYGHDVVRSDVSATYESVKSPVAKAHASVATASTAAPAARAWSRRASSDRPVAARAAVTTRAPSALHVATTPRARVIRPATLGTGTQGPDRALLRSQRGEERGA